MKIKDMDLSTAQHYYSVITNMIIGFSAAIGIGLTLIWTEKGIIWRKNVSIILTYLMFYFITVMYLIFLRNLMIQIAFLNVK